MSDTQRINKVYALFFWVVVRVVQIATNRPSARMSKRSTREQVPGGGEERTTYTTTRG